MSIADVGEIVDLAAKDTIFFGRQFFPRAIRQSSPEMHYEIAREIEDPRNRKVAVKIARDFAKTTLARVICAKRVSFAYSNTILIVSASAEYAYDTVRWIKHAIERQDHWAQTFGLVRGDRVINEETGEKYTWRDDKLQILNYGAGSDGGFELITVLGTGLFGQSRGLNIEDYRPDFILLDDVLDEDNTKTPEQRKKVDARIYGAIANTLAPRSESPDATLLFLQTPLHRNDAIEQAKKDKEWKYLEYGCFDEHGNSRWEERYPTVELKKEKQGFIDRNQLGIWLREKEVRITDDDLAYFISSWLSDHYWHNISEIPPVHHMTIYVGVDPTPPPQENKQLSSEDLQDLDDAVICVFGVHRRHVYVLDWYKTKSPIPNEFAAQLFFMNGRWRPKLVSFETVLFARTMKYYLEEKMRKERTYFRIEPIEDKRKKSNRIRQEITDLAFEGRLHVHPDHVDFIDQFCTYPDVNHDDFLDALSIGLMGVTWEDDYIDGEWEEIEEQESLGNWRHNFVGR